MDQPQSPYGSQCTHLRRNEGSYRVVKLYRGDFIVKAGREMRTAKGRAT